MGKKVTLILGDGIGPEIMTATQKCVDAVCDIEWDLQLAGEAACRKGDSPLPDTTLRSIESNKVALKGPLTTPIGEGIRSLNVTLRQKFDLYACMRPAQSINIAGNWPRGGKNVDIILVRENTEGLYIGVEYNSTQKESKELLKLAGFLPDKDAAVALRVITRNATKKVAEFCFKQAVLKNRKRVTVVHKANILKKTDGLFLEECKNVWKSGYADKIECDSKLVDNVCHLLAMNPGSFDVIVLPNLYGDIVSDLCAGLVGGLGICPGANIGDKIAIFEPVHGTAPDIAGKGRANPVASILSACMMLEHIGNPRACARLRKAVLKVLENGEVLTPDLVFFSGKSYAASTDEFVQAVLKAID
jgi:isocitrate dehydrogenase (NAD+)